MQARVPTISPTEALSILLKAKYLLCGVFFLLTGGIFGISYLLTPKYEAKASILINSGPEFQAQVDPGKEGLGGTPYLTKQEIINSEQEILSSQGLIERVIRSVGIGRLYPKIVEDPPSDMRPIDAAIIRFTKDLKVQPVTMSEVIEISYLNTDRDVALNALSALIKLYEIKHDTIFGESRAAFFASQLEKYEHKLVEISNRIARTREHKSVFNVQKQQDELIEDRGQVVEVLHSLEGKSADAHGRIAYYQKKLAGLSALVPSGETTSDAVDAARGKLLNLEVQLLQLRQRYTTDVKPILDIEQQIGSVRNFIAGRVVGNRNVWLQRDPAYDDARVKLQQAEADAASMDAQIRLSKRHLRQYDTELDNLVEGARDLEVLERNHGMLEDLARAARTRYEEAKASEDLDRSNIGSVNVLTEPDASTKPAKPKHLVFALVGCALGLFGVGMVSFYLLALRDRLITPESVARLLDIEVLGVVPLNRTAKRTPNTTKAPRQGTLARGA